MQDVQGFIALERDCVLPGTSASNTGVSYCRPGSSTHVEPLVYTQQLPERRCSKCVKNVHLYSVQDGWRVLWPSAMLWCWVRPGCSAVEQGADAADGVFRAGVCSRKAEEGKYVRKPSLPLFLRVSVPLFRSIPVDYCTRTTHSPFLNVLADDCVHDCVHGPALSLFPLFLPPSSPLFQSSSRYLFYGSLCWQPVPSPTARSLVWSWLSIELYPSDSLVFGIIVFTAATYHHSLHLICQPIRCTNTPLATRNTGL